MRPGQVERRTHDYVRHGTTSLFASLEVATGKVLTKCYRRHRFVEFRDFLDQIDAAVPKDQEVHIVLVTQDSQLCPYPQTFTYFPSFANSRRIPSSIWIMLISLRLQASDCRQVCCTIFMI